MPTRIPEDIINRIREATDIVQLVSQYIKLEKKGSNYFGLCPFHNEKTPSFSVHPGKEIFHCFGCGIGGNVFTFLQEHDKISFVEAAKELAQRAGITIPAERTDTASEHKFDRLYRANQFAAEYYTRCLWEGKGKEFDRARDYLKLRDISTELAKTFRLGYAPDRWEALITAIKKFRKSEQELKYFQEAGLLRKKDDRTFDRFRGRLMFPIVNLSGRIVGFGGRALSDEENIAKYINTQQTPIYEKGNLLYGLHQAQEQIRRRGECLIVEGYTDLMRLHEEGFTNSVASSGTALTAQQANLIRRFCPRVLLIFDGDSAGSHASLRGGDILLAAGLDVRIVGLPEELDPDSYVRDKGTGEFAKLIENASDIITFRIELYGQEGRLKDVPSRTAVARELLSTISVIPDPIKKELTAQEAAKRIGVTTEMLLKELGKIKKSSLVSAQSHTNGQKENLPFNVKEKGLLEALIRWPELRKATFREIDSDDFKHPTLKQIASRLSDLQSAEKKDSGNNLLDEEMPREEVSFISYALSLTESLTDPSVNPQAKRKYDDFLTAQDCLRDIITAKLNEEKNRLKAELLTKTDIENTLKIQKRIQQIAEEQKNIKQKLFWSIPTHPSSESAKEKFLASQPKK